MIKVQKLCAEARHHIHVVFKACHSNTKRVATGVNGRLPTLPRCPDQSAPLTRGRNRQLCVLQL